MRAPARAAGAPAVNFTEAAAKPLLRDAGIATPAGRLALTPDEVTDLILFLGSL